jgi:hypothetical protein
LYQSLSEPLTGTRYSFAPSRTNHTGLEISRPDVRPVTASSISRLVSKAFLNSSSAMRLSSAVGRVSGQIIDAATPRTSGMARDVYHGKLDTIHTTRRSPGSDWLPSESLR